MPDTLMLAFQRPSDAASKLLQRIAEGPCVEVGLVYEWVGNVPESVWDELIGNDLLNRYTATWAPGSPDHFRITRLGRLVLAACNTDAPDPVGKVAEAARVYMSAQDDWANSLAYGVGHLTDRLEAGLQDARRNLRKVLDELDRATGKAGEVG